MLQSSLINRVGSVWVVSALLASAPSVYADHHETKTTDSAATTDSVVVEESEDGAAEDSVSFDTSTTDSVTTDSVTTDSVTTDSVTTDSVTVDDDTSTADADSTAATGYDSEDGVEAANVDVPTDDEVVSSDSEVHSSEMGVTTTSEQTAEEEEEEEEGSPAVVEGETYDATTSTSGELPTEESAAGEHTGVHMDSTDDVEADSAGYGTETMPENAR